MHDLSPLTPLGGANAQTVTIGRVTITEVTDVALASVSARMGQSKPFAAAAKKLFGIALPDPGHWAAGKVYSLIWTGPDQWFAEGPFDSHEDIAALVKSGLGDTASVTEQTDGWVRFDVSGTKVVDLMERLCPVPARRMEAGEATRTILEHMGCIVVCRAKAERFSLLAPRSFAGSLQHALSAAATSIA